MDPITRPKIALIVTSYFAKSHADVIGTRLIEGYDFGGQWTESRVEVISMYLEQLGDSIDEGPRPDIGVEISDQNGIPRYPTVAEAIGCGRPGVNVDGVVIIGEHGDYEFNEYAQKLYPRRRLFDAAQATMIATGRPVPIFCDKHLAWSFTDARAMAQSADRIGAPLLAGSVVPLSWRLPRGAEWPLEAPMREAVGVGYGLTEVYGFHILEGMQSFAERRTGGETGVRSVRGFSGELALKACHDGTVSAELLDRALDTFELTVAEKRQAKASVKDVFVVEYADGLKAAAVNCDAVINNFAVSCTGPDLDLACQLWLQGEPHSHFIFLVRQIEALMLSGVAPYPIERTLLTTGVLDAAMRSRHNAGAPMETTGLDISYRPATQVLDTGITLPLEVVSAG